MGLCSLIGGASKFTERFWSIHGGRQGSPKKLTLGLKVDRKIL